MRPTTEPELRDAIAQAVASRTPLAIAAGGTKASWGGMVAARDTLDVSALTGIVAHEPEELVLTAKAGTTLREVTDALATHRQHLAFEPPDWGAILGTRGDATLGGTLACNAAGSRRPFAGAARDHLLGVAAVSGAGEVFKTGGRVVKNVSGYDLPKLLAGSFGTLAVMTEVSVKVMPAPEDSMTLVLHGLSDGPGVAALMQAAGAQADVSGLAHLPAAAARRSGIAAIAGGSATAIRVEGLSASVVHRLALLRDLLRPAHATTLAREESQGLWRAIRDVRLLPQDALLWRVSVPPSAGVATAAAIAAAMDADVLFDWCGGLLWVAVRGADPHAQAVRNSFAAYGGHATLVRAPDAVRAAAGAMQPLTAAVAALSRRVKAAFDPYGILNPGRMGI